MAAPSSDDASHLTAAERLALSNVYYRFKAKSHHGFDVSKANQLWAVRSAQLTAQRLQPYNDLLFTHLKSVIDFPGAVSALMEKIAVAKDKYDLCVPIWEYKHCEMPRDYPNDVEYYDHVRAYRAGDPKAKRAEVITAKGWRGLVGATRVSEWYGDVEFHYPLKEIDFVFRKTDLRERLALEFGGEYFSIAVHRFWETETVDDEEYHYYRCKVMLQYFPHRLPPQKLKELGKTAVRYQSHESEVPSTDIFVLENGTQTLVRRDDLYGPEGRL